jgi:hypothetical protein
MKSKRIKNKLKALSLIAFDICFRFLINLTRQSSRKSIFLPKVKRILNFWVQNEDRCMKNLMKLPLLNRE